MSEEQAKPPTAPQALVVPEKKKGKGTKGVFGHGKVSPDVGAATRIQKGEVRNPGGRPKKSSIVDDIYKIRTKRVPKALVEVLVSKGGFPGLQYGVTYGELGIVGQFLEVAKGKTANLELMARISGVLKDNGDAPQQTQVDFGRLELEDGSAREQLRITTSRFRERIAKRESITIDAQQ